MSAKPQATVRLCHLYPERMNIYADRGNIAVLRHRLAWRGYQLEVTPMSFGDQIEPGRYDLYYLGGGQDRDQDLVAGDLVTKGAALRAAADDGAAQLWVCGGIQLAGHEYVSAAGTTLPGIGLLDLTTTAGAPRLVGNIALDVDIDGTTTTVVGYENHAGRTVLGDVERFGTVQHGHGNNGIDGTEGARQNRVIGTYLHGPVLPRNPALADLVIGWALCHRLGDEIELEPLDDELEHRAQALALKRAAAE